MTVDLKSDEKVGTRRNKKQQRDHAANSFADGQRTIIKALSNPVMSQMFFGDIKGTARQILRRHIGSKIVHG